MVRMGVTGKGGERAGDWGTRKEAAMIEAAATSAEAHRLRHLPRQRNVTTRRRRKRLISATKSRLPSR